MWYRACGTLTPTIAALPQVLLPELRRLKRSFMKLATNQTTMRTVGGGTAARRMFADYLRHQLVLQQ